MRKVCMRCGKEYSNLYSHIKNKKLCSINYNRPLYHIRYK